MRPVFDQSGASQQRGARRGLSRQDESIRIQRTPTLTDGSDHSARLTVAIVTHNLHQAKRVADTTAFLYVDTTTGERTGYLVEFGPTSEIFGNPQQKHTQDYIAGAFS